mmetsp:Transcript_11551/g.14319  ORF Transcript_11551/g.14319 Transcript_11551/m.14319 type:complete len:282 (-) Transcript_11551:67-912(-)
MDTSNKDYGMSVPEDDGEFGTNNQDYGVTDDNTWKETGMTAFDDKIDDTDDFTETDKDFGMTTLEDDFSDNGMISSKPYETEYNDDSIQYGQGNSGTGNQVDYDNQEEYFDDIISSGQPGEKISDGKTNPNNDGYEYGGEIVPTQPKNQPSLDDPNDFPEFKDTDDYSNFNNFDNKSSDQDTFVKNPLNEENNVHTNNDDTYVFSKESVPAINENQDDIYDDDSFLESGNSNNAVLGLMAFAIVAASVLMYIRDQRQRAQWNRGYRPVQRHDDMYSFTKRH